MGITPIDLQMLRDECPFSGAVLQLGRQDIHVSPEEVAALGLPRPVRARDDHAFYSALGFTQVRSIDASDYQGADIIGDLNRPLPLEFCNRFDAVVDSGCMEHIFDVPQVLRNIHAALKPGGRVFHMSPTSNQVDHGFYSFSPTFFADYYETNRWRLERLRLIRFRLDWLHSRPTVHDYTPTDQLHLLGSSHCYGSEAIATWCVARKLTESTCDRIPTQMVYRKGAWTGSKPPVDPWNLGSVNLVKRLAKSLLPQGPYETARAALVRYVWGRRQLLRVLKSSRVRRK